MFNFYKISNKRRRLRRRLALFFLCLFVLEFSVHLEKCRITNEKCSQKTETVLSVQAINSETSNQKSVSPLDHKTHQDSKEINYQDELSHHQVLVSLFHYALPSVFDKHEPFVFDSARLITNSLPPPYLPPKFS